VAIPACAKAMWSAYSTEQGGVDEARFYEAFGFGDSPAMADELGQLVPPRVRIVVASIDQPWGRR